MSTSPRLDPRYKGRVHTIIEPSPHDTEHMRDLLREWQEQDRADAAAARRDAIICAALAVAVCVACYAFGVSLTEVPDWVR